MSMWVDSGVEGGEVPKCVVRRLGLGDLTVGLGFCGMDQVGKLDPVLNEEDGDVVADEIPVALLGVEADGKAADVAGGVGRASRARPPSRSGRRPASRRTCRSGPRHR